MTSSIALLLRFPSQHSSRTPLHKRVWLCGKMADNASQQGFGQHCSYMTELLM